MDAYKFNVWRNCTSGISTLWYGMNIPKSINVNKRLDPLNFHFDSTYPFMLPSRAEIATAGIERIMLFPNPLPRTSNALEKLFRVGLPVGAQMPLVATSWVVLSAVTIAT